MYLLWIGVFLSFMLLIPALSKYSDSSAQIPFVLGVYGIVIFVLGLLIISIFNISRRRNVGYLYLNIVILVSTLSVGLYFFIKMLSI